MLLRAFIRMSAQSPQATIHVSELTRNYGARIAVRNVSFEVNKGEVLGLLGPNGAGKSTTMQMLTGNLAPSSGTIRICGIDLLDQAKAAKAKLGYLPEAPPLYRDLTVDEYLLLAAKLHRVPKQQLNTALGRAKQRCGLNEVSKRLIGSLSKGFQQRVGIAQAIVHNPDVIILDEPTVGLDPIQIREIRALIRELGGEHCVILSTHILPEVESVCDRVQIMHQGAIVYNGDIAALKQLRQRASLMIGLSNPPMLDELLKVPGVGHAERVADQQFRIDFAPGADPTENLVKAAHEHSWGLLQLSPAQASLEDVFVQLTQREEGDQP